nr:hypothetical protein [Tanacetum cinerariifolium]
MSDASSAVTYTSPVAPPSLDYVPGPEHASSPDCVPCLDYPPSLVEIPYVSESEYLEYLAPSDDKVPLKDQPLPIDTSPIAASPGYVADSDLDEDPKEDPEDDHVDYPVDGRNGDDEPSNDDDDDDDTDDEDEDPIKDEEEEENLALADSFDVPIVDLVLPASDIEALEADESTLIPGLPYISIPLSQTRLCRARKTVRHEPSMSASLEACIMICTNIANITRKRPKPDKNGQGVGKRMGLSFDALIPPTSGITISITSELTSSESRGPEVHGFAGGECGVMKVAVKWGIRVYRGWREKL